MRSTGPARLCVQLRGRVCLFVCAVTGKGFGVPLRAPLKSRILPLARGRTGNAVGCADDGGADGCAVDGSSFGTVSAVGNDAFDSFYLRGLCFSLDNVNRLRACRRWSGRWDVVYGALLRFHTAAVEIQRWWKKRVVLHSFPGRMQ